MASRTSGASSNSKLRLREKDSRIGAARRRQVRLSVVMLVGMLSGLLAGWLQGGVDSARASSIRPSLAGSPYPSAVLADNPILYYRMDDATPNGPATDSSPNGHDGTYGSSVGSDSSALIGDADPSATNSNGGTTVYTSDSYLPGGDAPRTIEAWVKTTGDYGIADYGALGADGHRFDFWLSRGDNALYLDWWNGRVGANPPAGIGLADGQWHYVAVTYKDPTLTLYLDGQNIGTFSVPGLGTGIPSRGMAIGTGWGSIDEFGVYGAALSSARIEAHYLAGSGEQCAAPAHLSSYEQTVLGDKPLSYLPFGDATGTRVAVDVSGHCHSAAYANTASQDNAGPLVADSAAASASHGGAAAYGSDDYLPATNGKRTIEAWVKTTGDYGIADYGALGADGHRFDFWLSRGDNALYLDWWNGRVGANPPAGIGLADGQWHYVAVTYKDPTLTLYLDGQNIGTFSVPGLGTGIPSRGIQFGIGNGSIAQVAVYDVALTPDRIAAHYLAAAQQACATEGKYNYAGAILADSPISYLPLDDLPGSRVALDYSGNCHPGSYPNTAQLGVPGGLTGDDSTGVTSNGGTAVFAGDSYLPGSNAPRTIEAWVKTTGDYGIADYGALGADGHRFDFWLSRGDNALYLDWWNGRVGANPPAGIGLADGQWHYVAVTYKDPTLTLYLDGQNIGTFSVPGLGTGIPSRGIQFGIGNGSIAQVAIYGSALSQDRILAHWHARVAVPVGGGMQPSEQYGGDNPSENCTCSQGEATNNPINTATGDFWHTFQDFAIPSRGPDLTFSHTYNALAAATNGPLGFGWSASDTMSLSQSRTTGAVTVNQENGSQVVFIRNRDGSYSAASPRVLATLKKHADGSFTFVRRARTIFLFSAGGQLLKEQDLNGYALSLAYGPTAELKTITDAAGRSLSFTWTGAHITKITDPLARSVSFAYDARGDLASETDVSGGTTRFTYDGSHRLLTMTDPRGGVVTNIFDANGRVTSQTDPMKRRTTLDYVTNVKGQITQTTTTYPAGEPDARVTVEKYRDGQRYEMTRADGTTDAATWKYTYDDLTGGLSSVADPNGHVSYTTYDSRGNVLTTMDALDRITRHTYDALDDVLTTTDPSGVTTTMTYDSRGNLLSESRPLPGTAQVQTTVFHHGDAAHPGDITSVTDPDGHISKYTYNAAGNPLTVTDPLGNKTSYTYDILGRKLSATTPRGATTAYAYDAAGRLISTTDPLGNKTTLTYDADSNLATRTDPMGNVTVFSYDADNEQTQVVRPDKSVLRTEYNPDGTVADRIDGLGHKTKYAYDALGRQTSVTDALNHVTATSYDPAGNLTSSTDARGNTTTYGYDAGDERIATQLPDRATETTSYDADGRVVSQTDGLGRATTYTYDSLGRQISVTDPLKRTAQSTYDLAGNRMKYIDPMGRTTTYTYDADNRVTGILYSDGTTHGVAFTYTPESRRASMHDGTGTTTYTYDAAGNLIQVVDGAGHRVSYAYDKNGNMTVITYPAGTKVIRTFDALNRMIGVTDWLSHKTTYRYDATDNLVTATYPNKVAATSTYNAANQLIGITDKNGSGVSIGSFGYTRDENGNVATGSDSVDSSNHTYGYDNRDRLTNDTTGAGATNWTYDNANQLTQIVNKVSGETSALSYDDGSELVSVQKTTGGTASQDETLTYNANGDRTQAADSVTGSTVTYGYDQADRLTSYADKATTAKYAYNGDGLRMSKTVNGVAEPFAWDVAEGLPLLLEDRTTSYIYGPDGLPLEQVSASGAVLYYLHDQLASTRLLTDAAGKSVATYTYDAYGNTTAKTGTANNPFGYTGQYTDEESGMQYLRARYYDPKTGQFMSRDPLVAVTQSAYGYTVGNPMNGGDPTGLDGCGWNPLCYAGNAASSAWNATGGQVVHTIQNGGLPNGQCIVVIQNNCQSNVAANVDALHQSALGPLYEADPMLKLYMDKTRQVNGENVSNATINLDILSSFAVAGLPPIVPDGGPLWLQGISNWGRIPSIVAGPVLRKWGIAASLWNNQRWLGLGKDVLRNYFGALGLGGSEENVSGVGAAMRDFLNCLN